MIQVVMNGYGGCGTATECCRVSLGIGCAENIDCSETQKVGGMCDLRVTKNCYIDSIVELEPTECDKCVTNIIMATFDDDDDPLTPEVDYTFFLFCTEDDTLGHTFSWTCNDDTGNLQFSETVTGEISKRNAKTFCVLQEWMCSDVVLVGREADDNGGWMMIGFGGGLQLNTVEGGTGVLSTDSFNTTITFTGDDLDQGWKYIDPTKDVASPYADAEDLIDALTDTTT